ncbi:hypothetical protein LL06_20830 [Hoeflea sp. BAL378]|nr:hypothetical protein LL06_20830 [Hoeflea sp. BAL378]
MLDRAGVVERQGQAYIDRTKAAAAEIVADASAKAERLRGVGGAVRSVIDGVQDSRIRNEIRAQFARDLATATEAVERAKADSAKANHSRREAERKAADLRHSMRQQSQRLVATQQEVRRLSAALAAALDEPTPTPGGMTQ